MTDLEAQFEQDNLMPVDYNQLVSDPNASTLVTNQVNTDPHDQHQKANDQEKLKIYHVRKNQYNSMASFFYAFGCSIVHLGLFIGANCVK